MSTLDLNYLRTDFFFFYKNGHDSDVVSEQTPACEANKGVKLTKPNRYWGPE